MGYDNGRVPNPSWLLEKIFPLSNEDRAADSYCLAAAPILGDVITIAKPLVSYRIHGRNLGAITTLDGAQFGKEVSRAQVRFRYAQDIARRVGLRLPDAAIKKNLSVLTYRVASLRLNQPQHPMPKDTKGTILLDAILGVLSPQGIAWPGRVFVLIWACLVMLLPTAAAKVIILWRFHPIGRPVALQRLLRSLRVVR